MSGISPEPSEAPVHPDGRPGGGDPVQVRPEGEFRRLHPVTPWRRAWAVVAGIVAVLLRDPEQTRRWSDQLTAARVLIGLAVLLPVSFGYGFVSWRFTRYRLDETELRVDTGVLFRRTKHFRIDRLQSVDVTRPLVGRVIGVAKLRLDLAGGKDELAYLGERHAGELRAELLARAAGVAPDSGEAPERELVRVPHLALAVALLCRLSVWWAVSAALAVALVPALLTGNWLSVLFGVPVYLAVGNVTFGRFAKMFGWTVAESPDGLRLDYGLLDRAHETVPPGRVQSLTFRQPLVWRRADWMSVQMAVAGGGNDVLLPVAPREVALGTAARILPGLDPAAVATEQVPRRARWRAPLRYRVLACGADRNVFLVRHGLLTRTVRVVPHAKVQSVRLTQGPWQRLLRLASIHLDPAAGAPLTAAHRDATQAHQIVTAQAERSRTGRREALPDRWALPPAAPPPAAPAEGAPAGE